MPVATLIAAPRRRNLEPALAESLRNAWGGGTVVWLAPDEAAMFEVAGVPENLWEVWQDLQGLGVDLVVQDAARRRRLLLADMDSTMTEQECIDELAAEAGIGPRVAEITARAMNGELDFEAALTERVGLLEGLNAGIIGKVLSKRITLAPGGAACPRA
jgi:phosphoserine phosphatase